MVKNLISVKFVYLFFKQSWLSVHKICTLCMNWTELKLQISILSNFLLFLFTACVCVLFNLLNIKALLYVQNIWSNQNVNKAYMYNVHVLLLGRNIYRTRIFWMYLAYTIFRPIIVDMNFKSVLDDTFSFVTKSAVRNTL